MQDGDKIERLKEQVHRLVQRNKEVEDQAEIYRQMAKDLDQKLGLAYEARRSWEEAAKGMFKAMDAQESIELLERVPRDLCPWTPEDWKRVRA
jgi:hypothetical protein